MFLADCGLRPWSLRLPSGNLGAEVISMRVALLVLLIVASACSSSPTTPVLDMDDSGSTLEVEVGDTFTVNLHGNPSTGFTWLVEDYDETMVFMADQSYTENSSSRVGAGGEFTFEFEATRVGATDLELRYRRSWEEKPAERVFTLHLVIG